MSSTAVGQHGLRVGPASMLVSSDVLLPLPVSYLCCSEYQSLTSAPISLLAPSFFTDDSASYFVTEKIEPPHFMHDHALLLLPKSRALSHI